jgi:hypothetical protein
MDFLVGSYMLATLSFCSGTLLHCNSSWFHCDNEMFFSIQRNNARPAEIDVRPAVAFSIRQRLQNDK